MKKTLFISFSSLLLSGLLFAGPAPAQMAGQGSPHGSPSTKGHPGMPSMGHPGSPSPHGSYAGKGHAMGPNWKDTLNDKQKKAADEMHLKLEKALSLPKAAKDLKKKELRLMIVQENPDKKAIEEKIDEIMKLEANILLSRIGHKVEMRRMLTDDQRVSFDMMILSGPPHGK